MRDSDENLGTESDSSEFQPFMLSYSPDFPEVLKCVLNISKSEARTYLALLRNQNADARRLADALDRAENTVREQVATLREKGLATRDMRVPESGQYHIYQAVPPTEAKSMLHEVVDYWVVRAVHRIERLADSSTGESIAYRSVSATSSSLATTENISADAKQLLSDELPSLRSIATSVFGFTYPEMKLYLVLLDNPRSTAKELAEIQDLARTTVVGRLNVLQTRGLARPASRETEIGNSIAYEYLPRPLNEVKAAMTEQLNGEWIEHAHRCIDEFDLSRVDYRE